MYVENKQMGMDMKEVEMGFESDRKKVMKE